MRFFKRIKTALLVIVSMGVVLFISAAPIRVFAADGGIILENLCAGINLNADSDCSHGVSNGEVQARVDKLIKAIVNLLSMLVGVVSVIMIIVGGFKYITSGGDSSNVTGAKNTILYAVIGLVIVALSQLIVRFVLTKVTQ